MGPKKGGDQPSKKTELKQKEKVIEDKTFGLKNKNKSVKVQSYIKGVEHQVKGAGKSQQMIDQEEFNERAAKKKMREEEAFLNSLSKAVVTIKQHDCEDDDERKNMLCQFFAQKGFCEDGDDCKFSHDLNIEFNQGAFDIYTDLREAKAKLGIDFEMMEEREAKRSKMPKTNIVCKFFLDSIKNKTYGWKWACPNGDDCHYKHCLPKDYVIKSLRGDAQEDMTFEEFHDLEEKIDAERDRVAVNGTKVTEKTLAEWLAKRRKEKEAMGGLKKNDLLKKLKTGRELWTTNKDDFHDDENADDDVYVNEGNELELAEETKNLQDQLWGRNEEENKDGKDKDKDKDKDGNVKVDEDLFKDDLGDLDDVNDDENDGNDGNEDDS